MNAKHGEAVSETKEAVKHANKNVFTKFISFNFERWMTRKKGRKKNGDRVERGGPGRRGGDDFTMSNESARRLADLRVLILI